MKIDKANKRRRRYCLRPGGSRTESIKRALGRGINLHDYRRTIGDLRVHVVNYALNSAGPQ